MKKLSIIIPCYNEAAHVGSLLEKIFSVSLPLEKEIIVVDDGSTDGTSEVLKMYAAANASVRLVHQTVNSGKGAAVQKALDTVTGEAVIIQDSDLEYDPRDYIKMLQPVLDGNADVVYGSRFSGEGPRRVLFFFHTIGNKFLTFLSNLFTGLNLTDMESGYKLFRTEILKQVNLKEKRFGFEPEVTAKVSRIKNIRIYETGIRYYGRTYKDGKKISWQDGFRAIYCIFKYNIFSRK